jgi:hypothetical protein
MPTTDALGGHHGLSGRHRPTHCRPALLSDGAHELLLGASCDIRCAEPVILACYTFCHDHGASCEALQRLKGRRTYVTQRPFRDRPIRLDASRL